MSGKTKAVESALGVILNLGGRFAQMLTERGVTGEDILRLNKEKNEKNLSKIADEVAGIIRGGFEPLFPVLIDYALSIEEMVELGGHDCANPEVTSKHFPHDRTRGKEEVSLELVHFNRFISSDDAIRELEKQGLRPATLPELLAFGATYKDEQRKYPIVALGSVWRDDFGHRRIPGLWGGASRRDLCLDWWHGGWSSGGRFLAARK